MDGEALAAEVCGVCGGCGACQCITPSSVKVRGCCVMCDVWSMCDQASRPHNPRVSHLEL